MIHACRPLLLVVLFIGVGNLVAQMPPISRPTEFRQQPFDVQKYDVSLYIDNLASKSIRGTCTIQVLWTDAVSAPTFPFHLRGLTVDSVVTGTGRTLDVLTYGTPDLDTFHYRAVLETDVTPNEVTQLTVFYHGVMTNEGGATPWGGVHFADSVLYALGVGFANPEVSATAYWMTCYDHPSDKATCSLSFYIPRGVLPPWQGQNSAASIGTLFSESYNDTHFLFQWKTEKSTATYLYTFAVGPLRRLDLPAVEGTPVTIYTLARDSAASSIAYICVPRMTSLFNTLYGSFPFEKVGYVNTTIGAMEHQTLISFPISIVNKRDTINTTAAHELAHQWFGDYVTPLDFRHAWLTESFATYSEGAWLEEALGWSRYLQNLEAGARNYIQSIAPREGVFALYDFPRTSPSSNYPETIYRKGANVLSMARTIAGTDAFYAALRNYLEQHQYGNAVTEDMKAALSQALGSRTAAFFDEWVYGKGWPKVNVNFVQTQDGWTATLQQVQQQTHPDWPIFTTLPLNITFRHPTENRFVDTVIVMGGATYSIGILSPTDFTVNAGTLSRALVQMEKTTSVPLSNSRSPKVTIYPQPAHDVLRIELSYTVPVTMTVTGLDGKQVYEQTIAAGTDSTQIDVRSWSVGVYHLQVSSTSVEPQSIPFVISR